MVVVGAESATHHHQLPNKWGLCCESVYIHVPFKFANESDGKSSQMITERELIEII